MSSGSVPVIDPKGTGSLTFPNSYIVTLHPALTETQRKNHMDFAHRACHSKTAPGTREPAGIPRVYHYPFGSPNPEYYGYVGKFGKDVADEIAARKHEVESVRLEAMGTLCNFDFDTKKTPSWALSAISKGKGKPELEKAKAKALKDLVQEAPYTYKHIKSKGESSTIFILDTGYENKSHVKDLRLEAALFDLDTELTTESRTKGPTSCPSICKTGSTGTTPVCLAYSVRRQSQGGNGPTQVRLQIEIEAHVASERALLAGLKAECADTDRINFHGTNVALTAASSIWGSCAAAKVISYGMCRISAGESRPSETALVDALECMISRPEILKNSVVNCSWTMGFPDSTELKSGANQSSIPGPPYALRLFNDIAAAGAHIVASAGNSKLPLYTEDEAKKSKLENLKGCKVFDRCLPTAAKEVTIVGAIDREGYRADFSNYPSKGWPDIPFIWAPGVGMPGWKKNADPVELDGTSFAAPIVSGVIASIIAARDSALPLSRSAVIGALVKSLCQQETAHAGKNVYRLVGPRNPEAKQPAEEHPIEKSKCSIF